VRVSGIGRSAGAPLREAPASVGQRLLWFLDHYRTSGAALNCPIICRIDGPLDVARLREAVGLLTFRHEALRTTLERRGRQLWQVVHDTPAPDLVVHDLASARDPEHAARRAVEDELRTRIDPAALPLRPTLWRVGNASHIFCLNVNHLSSDAWSGAIQMRDLKFLYEGRNGVGAPLPPVELQYADFTARQEEYFRGTAFQRDASYWRDALKGASYDSIPLAAATDAGRRHTARARISIDPRETGLLKALARNLRTTLFSLMLTLYFTTVHRLTRKSDLAVASLFANRMRPDLQNTVGFIANLVVLRSVTQPGASFRAVQQSVQTGLREGFVHQACPLHLLGSELTVRDGRRADEAVFQMLPQALDRSRVGNIEIAMDVPDSLESRFEFEVTLVLEREQLTVIVLWNSVRLSQDWVLQFLHEYRAGVTAVLTNPDVVCTGAVH